MLTSNAPLRSGHALRGAVGLGLAALLLAGCASTSTSDVTLAAYDYRERHPIMISEEPEVLEIPVGMKGPALSRQIEAAVQDYVVEYVATGTGGITIQVPTSTANEIAARKTGQALHYALVRAGVPHASIVVVPYHVGNHARPSPVRLSFLKVKAVTPKCGVWPERYANRTDNAQYHNFGCAYQQNLAAQVANPADLVRPRVMEPANGARRAQVIGAYSRGLETKSETTLLDTSVEGL